MCILLDHGLRCGEIAILLADAINLSRGLLDFNQPKMDERQKHRLWATFAAEAGTPTKTLQVAGGWKSAKIALDYCT